MVQTQIDKPTIGIIYPPPELRNIVDKTASFVARNGPEFESRIKENEKNNVKFNFLNLTDPYNAYYKFKINEFTQQQQQLEQQNQANLAGLDIAKQPSISNQDFVKKLIPVRKITSIYDAIEVEMPKETPPEYEFSTEPPSISAQDLDIVKLTAQFVARNGRQFLTSLMHRESKNYQFDFLRPQHSLFNYFTKLVEQYTKVLLPPKDMVERLDRELKDQRCVVAEIKKRALHVRHCQKEKQMADDLAEKERLAYASIDWHDFVVVETVDFSIHEVGNFPAPTTPEEVGLQAISRQRAEEEEQKNRLGATMVKSGLTTGLGTEPGITDTKDATSATATHMMATNTLNLAAIRERERESALAQKQQQSVQKTTTLQSEKKSIFARMEEKNISTTQTEAIDIAQQIIDEEMGAEKPGESPQINQTLPTPEPDFNEPIAPITKGPDDVIIRKNYDPKAHRAKEVQSNTVEYLISPITGEKIPAHKMQEHMRIGLLDPQWIEQREKLLKEKKEQEEVYATGMSIGSSLKKLAERRTDIFGAGHKETYIGKKLADGEDMGDTQITANNAGTGGTSKNNVFDSGSITLIKEPVPSYGGLAGLSNTNKSGPGGSNMTPAMTTTKIPTQIATNNPESSSTASKTAVGPSKIVTTTISAFPPPPPSASAQALKRPPTAPINMPPPPTQNMMFMNGPPGATTGDMGIMHSVGGANFYNPHHVVVPPPHMMGGPLLSAGTISAQPVITGSVVPPAPKKPRLVTLNEMALMPEAEFLAQNPGPVQIEIHVPDIPDKPELKMHGQVLNVVMPLSDNISVIKAKIYESINLPAGKQKLQYQGAFIKDSNTLAYYNLVNGSIIELSLKERGGRKK